MQNKTHNIWDFLSLEWFLPKTFLEFNWEHEIAFYCLLLLPVLWVWKSRRQRLRRFKVEVASSQQLPAPNVWLFLRFIPGTLQSLSLAFLIIALARPQKTDIEIEQYSEGVDIILIMDVSESMLIEDFQPNRLEAAKTVAQNFIGGREYDRIGLVVFSGKAYSLAPLSTDYKMLQSYLQEMNQFMVPTGGTAIGNALGVATNRLRESKSTSKIIILISDGDNTAGSLDPITAAQLAAYYGIKMYTILVGKEGKVPMPTKIFGGRQLIDNTIDEGTLRQIANIGEGEFFRVGNNSALSQVFEQINQYEKSDILETRFKTVQDYYQMYLVWAIIFWLLWLFSKSSFIVNVLED